MNNQELVGVEPEVRDVTGGAAVDVAQARAAQEVQAAMVIAKRFPRDTAAAFGRIRDACKRPTLAERAIYTYPRGGQAVTGPSIRLAEVLAQNWGNLDFGIIELEQRDGGSDVMAYAWDLETNTRQVKVFTIKHERHTRRGVSALTDPRDVYELTANNGARRLRACILGVIPGDVVDAAVDQCEKTLAGGHQEPRADRIRKMAEAFDGLGVTAEMLQARLGHPIDKTSEHELVTLRGIYSSIKDGMSSVEDHFASPTNRPTGEEALRSAATAPPPAPPAAAPTSGTDSGPEPEQVEREPGSDDEPENDWPTDGEMFENSGGDPEGAN